MAWYDFEIPKHSWTKHIAGAHAMPDGSLKNGVARKILIKLILMEKISPIPSKRRQVSSLIFFLQDINEQ